MKTIYPALIISLLFTACKKEQKIIENPTEASEITIQDSLYKTDTAVSENEKTELSETTDNAELKLDTFGFPAEVDGCSCYFAENKKDFEAQKFIYVDDYMKKAFISIGQQQIQFPMKDGTFNPENFSRKLKNSDYKIELKGKNIKEMYEVFMFEGTMTVENLKTGAKTSSRIYGECGC